MESGGGFDVESGPDPLGDEVERVVALFEGLWARGVRPRVEDHLPDEPALRASAMPELAHAELEFRLKLGERARVEEYLRRFPGLSADRGVVLGLVEAERRYRSRREPGLDPDEFAARFPDLAGSLAAAGPAPLPRAAEPPPAGQTPGRVGRFALGEELGRGAFGVVFRAWDTELGRDVAVKLRHGGGPPGAAGFERFRREARSAANLCHPNIVPVHEVGRDAGSFYIVSGYVEGEVLSAWAARRRPDPPESAALVRVLAGAVEYAHRQGVVHRDIKPSNVVVDPDGRPHLLDFGLARRESGEASLTCDGEVLGTPAYMAPEQALGRHDRVGPWSDVYSLGVVLYELLAGERPFRGHGRVVLWQVVEDDPPPPRRRDGRVPRDLERVCLKALAKSPAARYATAAALADDLGRFLRGEPVAARPGGPVSRAWRRCRRRPVLTGAVAALALSAAATAAVLAGHRARSEALAREGLQRQSQSVTRFSQANQAILGFVDLTRNRNLQGAAAGPAREGILRAAAEYYEGFARTHAADPAFGVEVATAHRGLADARNALGDVDGAIESAAAADAAWDRLLAAGRSTAEARLGKADTLLLLGSLQRLAGRLDEARRALEGARAAWEALARERPDDPGFRGALGDALLALSQAEKAAGRPTEALESLRAALPGLEDRAATSAGDNTRGALATAYYYLGELTRAQGRPAEALEAGRRSLDVGDGLVARHPEEMGYATIRARAQFLVAASERDLGHPREALEGFRRASRQYDDLVTISDRESLHRDRAASRHGVADALDELGRLDEAAAAFRLAADAREDLCRRFPSSPVHPGDAAGTFARLADTLARLGRPADASAALRAAVRHAEAAHAAARDPRPSRKRLDELRRQLAASDARPSNK